MANKNRLDCSPENKKEKKRNLDVHLEFSLTFWPGIISKENLTAEGIWFLKTSFNSSSHNP